MNEKWMASGAPSDGDDKTNFLNRENFSDGDDKTNFSDGDDKTDFNAEDIATSRA